MAAGVLGLVGLLVAVLLLFSWRSYRRSMAALEAAIPEDLRQLPDSTSLASIRDPRQRAQAFLEAADPAWGRLVKPRLEALGDGRVLVTSPSWGAWHFEVAPSGDLVRAEVARAFELGGAVIDATGAHLDPQGVLAGEEAWVTSMVEQLGEASVRQIRLDRDRVAVVYDGNLFALGRMDAMLQVSHLLACLESAATWWAHQRAEPEPEPDPDADLPSDPVARTFARAQRASSDEGVALAHEALRVVFAACEPLLEKPKVVLGDGLTLGELRGRLGGMPVRLILSDTWLFEIEAKVDVGGVAFYRYDPNLAATGGDPDDPFSEEDGQRVFVAKGVYCEGTPGDVEAFLQYTAGMDPAQLELVRTTLIELQLFNLGYAMDAFHLRADPYVYDLADPVAWARRALSVIPELVRRHGKPVSDPPSVVACAYCGSRFFFGVRRLACPNCGAPHGAAG